MTNAKPRITTKQLAIFAMLCVIAFGLMATVRIPNIGGFLTYEPKDIIITIGGFMFGPLAAAGMSIIVAFLEMMTVSTTGPIGMLMNVLAGCAFACTSSFIYRRMHNLRGAVIGLSSGVVAMNVLMILWNFIITPIYMNIPVQAVVDLLPLICGFNILKTGLNMAAVMLLYKPIVTALRKANLLPPSTGVKTSKTNIAFVIAAAVLLCTCVLLILSLAGKI